MKSTRIKITLTAIISVILTLAVSAGAVWVFAGNSVSQFLKYLEIKQIVDQHYLWEYDASAADDAMYKAYMESLGDKYSRYYTSEEAAEKNDALEGNFHGIGISAARHPDTRNMYIVHVFAGSPAAAAGLMDKDEIVAVGDKKVSEDYEAAYNYLRGMENEKVEITYSRDGVMHDTEVTYGDCTEQSVFSELFEEYGYIEITKFNYATVDQFKDAVDNLVAAGARGLIFDLRSNSGGTVDSVCQILDYICHEGDLMYVTYAYSEKKHVLRSSDNEDNIELPMAVLTDGGTASAAELFAADIRDFNKGVLIGDTTYGKGIMQATYSLKDGSAVKMTIAEYFPHSAEGFHGEGLEPDIKVTLTEEQQSRLVLLEGREDPVVAAAQEWFKNEEN